MAIVFMTDPTTGRCALYDENGSTGDFNDPNSARNAPLNSPASHLDKVYFHSDFDYMEVSHGPTAVTVNHAALSIGAAPPGQIFPFGYTTAAADHLLLTHSLGYPPLALVIYDGNVCWPGMPVQADAGGGARFVTAYVTNTELRLYEFASVGSGGLPAVSREYTVLVFRAPPAPSGDVLLDFDPATGVVQMGLGKFDSSRRYLQVVPGGSPFGLSLGRTIDLNNGAPRAVRPDGTSYDPVPSGLQLGLGRGAMGIADYGYVYGASMAYGGSFTGSGSVQVQAP
ncbi:hypothetical protein [uncultured Devosia sp.]|uniref:hypothetical protein n=1 Tax=uncultured Devosia sp. TaxID=211434 RepID=UPI0026162A63|nr:hypothetical protein [uncultured Devosia sp.]